MKFNRQVVVSIDFTCQCDGRITGLSIIERVIWTVRKWWLESKTLYIAWYSGECVVISKDRARIWPWGINGKKAVNELIYLLGFSQIILVCIEVTKNYMEVMPGRYEVNKEQRSWRIRSVSQKSIKTFHILMKKQV